MIISYRKITSYILSLCIYSTEKKLPANHHWHSKMRHYDSLMADIYDIMALKIGWYLFCLGRFRL